MDQIDAIIADLDANAEQVAIDLALEITADLQVNTPIDIGWARAGWTPTIGEPYQGGRDLKPDPALVTVARARQAEGLNEVLQYRLTDGPIWITNNVVYINRLNEGWSKQAPSGFVQTTIAQAVETVRARNA